MRITVDFLKSKGACQEGIEAFQKKFGDDADHDYRRGVVSLVRTDTGAVEKERSMTSEERQASLL